MAWPYGLDSPGQDLRADRATVLETVRHCGWALREASADLQKDRQVVQAAIKQNGVALQWADVDLRADKDMVLLSARSSKDEIWLKKLLLRYLDQAGIADVRHFLQAMECGIGIPGAERVPIITVELSYCESDDNNLAHHSYARNGVTHFYECDATLMSGRYFYLAIPDMRVVDDVSGKARPEPILKDLVNKVLIKLREFGEMKNHSRVFINFLFGSDGDAMIVSPWDWDRPLADFLLK